MGINLSGQVPGEQLNGLADMDEDLLDERTPEPFIAIVVMERASRKYDDVKQVTSAVVRFKHIEPIEDEADAQSVRSFLEKAYQRRTGAGSMETTLDIPDDGDDDESEEPAADEAVVNPPVDIATKGPKDPMWEPSPDDDGTAA